MARYRRVAVRIWNDERFMALPELSKLVFLFVLTHPNMTSLGAMRASLEGLAVEIRWRPVPFRKAFQELTSAPCFVEYDPQGPCVAVPKFLKHNPPENANVVKSWASQLDLIPECSLKNATIARVAKSSDTFSKKIREALPKIFLEVPSVSGKAFRVPDPDPEPDPEPDPDQKKTVREPIATADPDHERETGQKVRARAGAFCERYRWQIYPKLRGVAYTVSRRVEGEDLESAIRLCMTYTDRQLDELAEFFLSIPEDRERFLRGKTRTITMLLSMTSEIARRLWGKAS